MTDVKTGNPFYDTLLKDYVSAQQAQASRPIQTSQTSKPLEYNDMLKRRNQIGAERAALANALKQRENFGYGFANALANMPAQQGYGSWLGDFARGFGLAYNARTNSEISRAEKDYENAQKDLADALMYDRAMGEEQIMGYKPFAYSSGKNGATNIGGTQGDISSLAMYANLPDLDIDELNKQAGRWETNTYQPDNPEHGFLKRMGTLMLDDNDYGIARSKGTKQAKAYQDYETSAFQGMFDVLKALRPATDTDVLVALRTAGADPVAHPGTRDIRLTGTLNQELAKGGFEQVKDLRQWVDSVRFAREFGKWTPQEATKYFNNKREAEKNSRNNNLKLDSSDGWQVSSGGAKWRIKQ